MFKILVEPARDRRALDPGAVRAKGRPRCAAYRLVGGCLIRGPRGREERPAAQKAADHQILSWGLEPGSGQIDAKGEQAD